LLAEPGEYLIGSGWIGSAHLGLGDLPTASGRGGLRAEAAALNNPAAFAHDRESPSLTGLTPGPVSTAHPWTGDTSRHIPAARSLQHPLRSARPRAEGALIGRWRWRWVSMRTITLVLIVPTRANRIYGVWLVDYEYLEK